MILQSQLISPILIFTNSDNRNPDSVKSAIIALSLVLCAFSMRELTCSLVKLGSISFGFFGGSTREIGSLLESNPYPDFGLYNQLKNTEIAQYYACFPPTVQVRELI
jgi:hypothetical protein